MPSTARPVPRHLLPEDRADARERIPPSENRERFAVPGAGTIERTEQGARGRRQRAWIGLPSAPNPAPIRRVVVDGRPLPRSGRFIMTGRGAASPDDADQPAAPGGTVAEQAATPRCGDEPARRHPQLE